MEVPTLAALRVAAGKSATSADFALVGLIQSGRLPQETHCVLCGGSTSYQAVYRVVCERPVAATPEMPLWQWAFFLVIAPIHMLWAVFTADGGEVHGAAVDFVLPVRVCEFCVKELTTHAAVRDAMCRTPVYAALFEKYPQTQIRNGD